MATDQQTEAQAEETGVRPWHDVSCVIHAHSSYSDGNAGIPEIAAAARACGRRAVLVTDHDTLGARRDGWEGWHDGVLVVVGHEISSPEGHMLAFGLDSEVEHEGRSEREIVAEISDRGGLAIAAHPFSEGWRVSTTIGPPHAWQALDDERLDGLELWSLLTDEAERWSNPIRALRFMRDPRRHMARPPIENLRAWDRLCRRRRVVAVGGLDAHQRGIRLGRRLFSPFRYRRLFGLLGTHVLCRSPLSGDDGPEDVATLLEGLREGRCYLSIDWLGDPTGFEFTGRGGSVTVPLGGESGAAELELEARVPADAELRLLRDGEEIGRERGRSIGRRVAERGAYRIEALRRERDVDRTWILSNPIYLR